MNQEASLKTENPMRKIRLGKITLNAGAGMDTAKLEKSKAILEKITTKKTITIITVTIHNIL